MHGKLSSDAWLKMNARENKNIKIKIEIKTLLEKMYFQKKSS